MSASMIFVTILLPFWSIMAEVYMKCKSCWAMPIFLPRPPMAKGESFHGSSLRLHPESIERHFASGRVCQDQSDDVSRLNDALRLLSKWRSVLIQNTLLQQQGTIVLNVSLRQPCVGKFGNNWGRVGNLHYVDLFGYP